MKIVLLVISSTTNGLATELHILVNRVSEVCRGKDKHGSCGFGIGVTALDKELYDSPDITVKKPTVLFLKVRDHARFKNRMPLNQIF
jgi:hypothetical protein